MLLSGITLWIHQDLLGQTDSHTRIDFGQEASCSSFSFCFWRASSLCSTSLSIANPAISSPGHVFFKWLNDALNCFFASCWFLSFHSPHCWIWFQSQSQFYLRLSAELLTQHNQGLPPYYVYPIISCLHRVQACPKIDWPFSCARLLLVEVSSACCLQTHL